MSVSCTTVARTAEGARQLHSTSFSCPVCRTEMGRLADSFSNYVPCKGCSRLSSVNYQLARRGHRPVAVDLLDNETDGLGAARYYSAHLRHRFLCVQAEMDHLPFTSAQFDIVHFNAAFHYSVDYEKTVDEALRCLRRPGNLIISDSPFYRDELSGPKMIEEKRSAFEKRYGFRSDSIPSREYLTRPMLDHLAEKFGLRWRTLKPWYGINWALRPLKAYVSGKREPSNFYLFWAQVQQSGHREKLDRAELSKIGRKTT
jgi:SAM-dependent methyltransferase